MPNEYSALGPALRLLRDRRSLRQYQVASNAGITKAMLSAYETGKKTPSLKTLFSVLQGLNSDFAEYQSAVDVLCGKRIQVSEEDLPPRSTEEAQAEVVEFVSAKLGALLALLTRIADALELAALTAGGSRTRSSGERLATVGSDLADL